MLSSRPKTLYLDLCFSSSRKAHSLTYSWFIVWESEAWLQKFSKPADEGAEQGRTVSGEMNGQVDDT